MLSIQFNKPKDQSWIGKILLSYTIFICFIYLFTDKTSTRSYSYLIFNTAAVISMVVVSLRSKAKFGFSIFTPLLLGYLIKTLIGLAFWQFYIFPDYFTIDTSSFSFKHEEYLMTESWMRQIAEYRIAKGIFTLPPDMLTAKNFFIHYIMSNIYISGSFNPLDLSVQNILFSSYTAIIIANIVRRAGGNNLQIRAALLIAILQPMTMISTIIWRDTVGQFFVALGGYLIYRSTLLIGPKLLVYLLLASFSMLIQRLLYAFFPIFSILGFFIFARTKKITQFIYIPISLIIIQYLNQALFITDQISMGYGQNISSILLWLLLPLNIVRLFIGPLPWTTWFEFTDTTIFLISDYFQAAMNITLAFITYLTFRRPVFDQNTNNLRKIFIILFFMFIIAGIGVKDIHLPYMATGVIFLIPNIVLNNYGSKTFRYYNRTFLYLLLFNLLYVSVGLEGAGLVNIIR